MLAVIVSHQTHPFYDWIRDTPLERVGRRLVAVICEQQLRWRERLVDARLLREEDSARQSLIAEIERIRPTDAIVLGDGRLLFGRASAAGEGLLSIRVDAETGPALLKVPQTSVRWRQSLPCPPVDLAPRDVRFLLNFPDFRHYYMPPFLFTAETPFGQVAAAHEILRALTEEFVEAFRPLLAADGLEKLAYVCIFRNEKAYLRYAVQQEGTDLERSVGFYSQTQHCLFVYDRVQSLDRIRLDRQIEQMVTSAAAVYGEESLPRLRQLAAAERVRTQTLLRLDFARTLRHEGAHLLAYENGLHSALGSEPLWVPEGLAQYCETVPVGGVAVDKLRLVQEAAAAARLIPWLELVDTPTPRGFGQYGSRADLAYAQSWFLFRSLMEKPSQPRFLRFLDRVRAAQTGADDRRCSEILAECLEQPFLQVSRQLSESLRSASVELPPPARWLVPPSSPAAGERRPPGSAPPALP
jgi:hypothetical protein